MGVIGVQRQLPLRAGNSVGRILFRVSVGHISSYFCLDGFFFGHSVKQLNWEFKEFLEMGIGEEFCINCVGLLVFYFNRQQFFTS